VGFPEKMRVVVTIRDATEDTPFCGMNEIGTSWKVNFEGGWNGRCTLYVGWVWG